MDLLGIPKKSLWNFGEISLEFVNSLNGSYISPLTLLKPKKQICKQIVCGTLFISQFKISNNRLD